MQAVFATKKKHKNVEARATHEILERSTHDQQGHSTCAQIHHKSTRSRHIVLETRVTRNRAPGHLAPF